MGQLSRISPHVREAATQRSSISPKTMAEFVRLLHEQIPRYLGTEMFAPEGDRVIALALLDIYSHALISGELATSAGASFDRGQQPPA